MLWVFNCNRYILMRLWVKLVVPQGWVQTEIAVHNLCSVIIPYLKLQYIFNCTSDLVNLSIISSQASEYVKLNNRINWEYLTIWKSIYVHIKPNLKYCLRNSLQCHRTNVSNTNIQRLLLLYISVDTKKTKRQ